MKARYNDYPTVGREDKTEALGINARDRLFCSKSNCPLTASNTDPFNSNYVSNTSSGMSTATAEALGDSASNSFAEMSFTIEKAVTAVSRALKLNTL